MPKKLVHIASDIANANTGSHLPNCPPDGTVEGPLVLYRLVRNDPPICKDLNTTAEDGLRKDAEPCLRNAVSLWATEKKARALQRNVPPFRNCLIAVGTVGPGVGSLKNTIQSGHWSWWPLLGFARHSIFKVI